MSREIVLRSQARQQGLKHYFTGLPCVRGHIDYRFTSIGKCMACTREDAMKRHVHTTAKRRGYSNQAEFLAAVADRDYDYSRAVYVGAKVPLEIICSVHGSFWQRPTNHVNGQGCPSCAAESTGRRSKKQAETFIADAVAVWGKRFDYSSVVYA